MRRALNKHGVAVLDVEPLDVDLDALLPGGVALLTVYGDGIGGGSSGDRRSLSTPPCSEPAAIPRTRDNRCPPEKG